MPDQNPQTMAFYKPSPTSDLVIDQNGSPITLDMYKQLTGQINVPENQLNWSFVQNGSPMMAGGASSGSPEASMADGSTGTLLADPDNLDLSRGDTFYFTFPATHGNTIYQYDKNSQIYVPFTSDQAFFNKTGQTVQQALAGKEVTPLARPATGVTVVPDDKGIGDDGHLVDPTFIQTHYPAHGTTAPASNTYGKPDNANLDNAVSQNLGALFSTMLNKGDISQQTFDRAINNPANHALYISALAYGGYTFDDVYRDIKAKDMGLPTKSIDPSVPADQFYKTTDYLASSNDTRLNPPTNLGISSAFFNNPIFKIPAEAFQAIIPPVDKNSQQFKDAANQIQTQYTDTMLQLAEAQTAEQHQVAQQGYENLKQQVKDTFGFTLSNNAQAAWNQLQQLSSASAENNTVNSGMYNEAMDNVLSQQRKTQDFQRKQNQSQEESRALQYYSTSASPEEIAALTPEQRQQYGLTPSQDLTSYITNLKQQYPNISQAELDAIKNSLVDPNGNLYSGRYQGLAKARYSNYENKTATQQQAVENQALNSENQAMAPYSASDNPFVRYSPTDTPGYHAVPTTPPSQGSSTPPAATPGLQMPGSFSASSPSITPPAQTPAPKLSPPTSSQSSYSMPAVPGVAQGNSLQGNQVDGSKDMSNDYGLDAKGTVYNLKTGLGYSNPDDFFKASGANSFNGLKFKTDYSPSFYKYDNGPTIYNSHTNQPISNLDSYYQQGGSKDFSNVTTKNRSLGGGGSTSTYA